MKRYLVLALAALALAIAAPSAFATRVVFDPPTPVACTQDAPCNILVLGQPYVVNFLPCSQLPPQATNADNYNWCLWLNNVSAQGASKFTFQFLVPDGGSDTGGDLQCVSIPENLATSDCPAALPAVGDSLTVSFFVQPPLSNNFYLFTDFVNSPLTATVTASVPEPGALGLFGLGLLVLGVGFGWQKRRQPVRAQ